MTALIVLVGLMLALLVIGVATASKAIALILGVVLLGGLAWIIKTSKTMRLEINDEGITQYRRTKTVMIRWEDIASYRYFSGQQNQSANFAAAGLLGVAIGAAVNAAKRRNSEPNRNFSLGFLRLFPRGGGKSVTIASNYENAAQAIEQVFAEIHPRLSAQSNPNFGPFCVEAQSLTHVKKGSLSFSEIEHVSVSGHVISVKKRDKRLMWASIAMMRLDNSMLMLEQLAAAGVVVKPSHDVFVPRPALNLFQQTAARHAALPKARVHVG
jgi:hypothetical protein